MAVCGKGKGSRLCHPARAVPALTHLPQGRIITLTSAGCKLERPFCGEPESMAKWLASFRPADEDRASVPQPFELSCECGQRHSGLRRRMHQRIVCRACGAALFVLPKDPYPNPSPPKVKKSKRADEVPVGDDPVGDESEPRQPRDTLPPPGGVRARRTRRRRERGGREPSDPVADAANKAAEAVASAASATGRTARSAAQGVSSGFASAVRGFLQWWTPLKLTALAMVIIITGTIYWTVVTSKISSAERSLNPAVEAGYAALDDGDLLVAETELAAAVRALDILQRDDNHARTVRQTYREVRAINHLLSDPLVQLLEEAEATVAREVARRRESKPDPDEQPPPLDDGWATRFRALYADKSWIVMQVPVQKLDPLPEQPHRFAAAFPILIGDAQRPVELRVDFPVFDEVGIGKTPESVLFGGRLKSCRLAEDESRWIVHLDPDSGFLWVGMDTYRRLGLGFETRTEEEIEAVLSVQARATGVQPRVPADPEVPL